MVTQKDQRDLPPLDDLDPQAIADSLLHRQNWLGTQMVRLFALFAAWFVLIIIFPVLAVTWAIPAFLFLAIIVLCFSQVDCVNGRVMPKIAAALGLDHAQTVHESPFVLPKYFLPEGYETLLSDITSGGGTGTGRFRCAKVEVSSGQQHVPPVFHGLVITMRAGFPDEVEEGVVYKGVVIPAAVQAALHDLIPDGTSIHAVTRSEGILFIALERGSAPYEIGNLHSKVEELKLSIAEAIRDMSLAPQIAARVLSGALPASEPQGVGQNRLGLSVSP